MYWFKLIHTDKINSEDFWNTISNRSEQNYQLKMLYDPAK